MANNNFNYLSVFLEVAKLKSFSKASESLNIAQSAVSRQIKLLEQRLKKQLIIRSTRSVSLTPFGVELYNKTQDFDSWCNVFSDDKSDLLRVAIPGGVLEGWFVNKISEYKKNKVPNLWLQTVHPEEVRTLMDSGECDIGISPYKIDNNKVTSRVLLREEFYLISSTELNADSIKSETWISSEKSHHLSRIYKNIKPKRFMYTDSISVTVKLVQKGLGIAVVPDHMLPTHFNGYKTRVKIKNETLYINILNYKYLSSNLRSFIMFLLEKND